MYTILEKRKLNDLVDLMKIKAPYVSRRCEPGQFIILRVDEDGERIPLTIADYDREEETITIIYQVAGYSTKKLSQKEVGDTIEDFVGPLGQEAPLPEAKKVLGIGGGVGIAPLYPQLKKIKSEGAQVDAILGGRSEDIIILKEESEAVCDHVYYATNDGSKGMKGFVTDQLKALIEAGETYDLVIAIGPLVMMKAVCEITKEYNITTIINTHDMNSVMEIGEKIIFISKGNKVWEGTKDGIFDTDNEDLNNFVFASELYKKIKKIS
jgi:ferredoxin--NADP+ reductase